MSCFQGYEDVSAPKQAWRDCIIFESERVTHCHFWEAFVIATPDNLRQCSTNGNIICRRQTKHLYWMNFGELRWTADAPVGHLSSILWTFVRAKTHLLHFRSTKAPFRWRTRWGAVSTCFLISNELHPQPQTARLSPLIWSHLSMKAMKLLHITNRKDIESRISNFLFISRCRSKPTEEALRKAVQRFWLIS